MEEVGKFIASCRIKQKITQQELSNRTGLSKNFISIVENGGANVSPDKAIVFAKALNMTKDDIGLFYAAIEKSYVERAKSKYSVLLEFEKQTKREKL